MAPVCAPVFARIRRNDAARPRRRRAPWRVWLRHHVGGTSDLLLGGVGEDSLHGQAGNDWLDGGADDDTLKGGAGQDTLIGGSGDAPALGGVGDDRIMAGAGNDRAQGGAGRDTLVGGLGKDSLAGGSGDDRLEGDAGNDTLLGGASVDELRGGTGDDRLDGGAGEDLFLCTPGDGDDTIVGSLPASDGDCMDALLLRHPADSAPITMEKIVGGLALQYPPGTEAVGPQWKIVTPAGVPPFLELVGGSF